MLEIAGKRVPGIIGKSATALDLFSKIAMDVYNPLMLNYEVSENAMRHIIDVAGGVGIAAFSVELGAAVTALTSGNVVLGTLSGAAFYFVVTQMWDTANGG